MEAVELKEHFKERLKTKAPNPAADALLSADTLSFLQKIGLPDNEDLGFFFDEKLAVLPDNLIQLEFGEAGRTLCLDIAQNEALRWLDDPTSFVNSGVREFVLCVYEFEKYYQDIASQEVFGAFYDDKYGSENRKKYADYLANKFRRIDPAVFDKGYYWPAFIESIELGV